MSQMTQSFSTGICGCFSDCGICCYGAFCTPCLYGDNVSKLEGGGCCGPCCVYSVLNWMGFQCCVAGPTRRKIRELHELKEEPCSDCCTHFCCSSLAVCQEAREIKAKGTKPGAPLTQVMVAPAPATMYKAG